MKDEEATYVRALRHLLSGRASLAGRLLGRLTRARPGVALYAVLLGESLLAQERHEAAARSYRRALSLLPPLGCERTAPCGCRAPSVPSIRRALATALDGSGDLEAAVAEIESARAEDPRPADHVMLGEIAERRGRPAEARRQYLLALQLERDHAPALAHLGTLDLFRRPARAERRFGRALAQDPSHGEALCGLALCRLESGRVEEAERLLSPLVGAAGESGVRALVYLSFCCRARGDLLAAETYLRQARAAGPRDDLPLFALGDLRKEQGDPAAARRCYEAALRVGPASADAALRLGLLLLEEGEPPSRALELLERALVLAPQHPWAPWIESSVLPGLKA